MISTEALGPMLTPPPTVAPDRSQVPLLKVVPEGTEPETVGWEKVIAGVTLPLLFTKPGAPP
jgi:hypothetical protein